MVRKAAYYLLTMSKVSGQTIEVFLGHCTYCSLVNRDLLVCFSAAYAFIQKHYYKPVPLWTSVRDEIKAFGGVLIFAEGSWGWAWSPKAYMFDSCLTGFSISSSVVPPEKVGEIGRIQERSRWRLGAEKARTAALTAAGFAMNDSGAPHQR